MPDGVSPVRCGSGEEKHTRLVRDGGDAEDRAESVAFASTVCSTSGEERLL